MVASCIENKFNYAVYPTLVGLNQQTREMAVVYISKTQRAIGLVRDVSLLFCLFRLIRANLGN